MLLVRFGEKWTFSSVWHCSVNLSRHGVYSEFMRLPRRAFAARLVARGEARHRRVLLRASAYRISFAASASTKGPPDGQYGLCDSQRVTGALSHVWAGRIAAVRHADSPAANSGLLRGILCGGFVLAIRYPRRHVVRFPGVHLSACALYSAFAKWWRRAACREIGGRRVRHKLLDASCQVKARASRASYIKGEVMGRISSERMAKAQE